MTAPPQAVPPPAASAPQGGSPAGRPATPAQLAWLETQLREWRTEGLLDEPTAARIRGRYVAHRRVTLTRIVLTLGAAFVGLGLIWLVAANLDAMSPGVRLALVAAVWLGLVVGAELLAARRERAEDVPGPVVGAVRLLAAAAFGAVVFQAAQSLQVPAYEALLVGLWALGALVYGYAVVGLGPVVLGIVLGAVWLVWEVADTGDDLLAVTVAVGAGALAAVAVGVLHHVRSGALEAWRPLGVPWREVGAVLALGALFVAATPVDDGGSASTTTWVVLGVGIVLALAALVVGETLDRLEVGLGAAALALTALLAVWRPATGITESADLTGGDWARAVVAVVVYLGVASGYAVLGGQRDSDRLTWVATGALVVFVTVQAFAVFAPILSGAVLFLAVGVVLLATGVVADRGRRRLVGAVREVRS